MDVRDSGVAGSTIGLNTGSVAGAIGGAIIGGLAGNANENSANKKNGVEITVKLNNGQVITVAQGADPMHGPLSSARTCA